MLSNMKLLSLIYNRLFYRPILRCRLGRVGESFRFGYSSELINPQFFHIGRNFFSGPYGYYSTNEYGRVTIGDNVMFGPRCMIIGGNHDYRWTQGHMSITQRATKIVNEIIVEDGVWVGAGTTLLSGAKIGEGAVIGAMSLVNGHVPPCCIAVGIPAKRFFPRFDNYEDLAEFLNNTNSKYTLDEIINVYKTLPGTRYKLVPE